MSTSVNQGAAYGKCVAATTTGRQELKKDLCAREFEALKTCFVNAVSDKISKHSTGFRVLENHYSEVFFFFFFITGKEKSQMNGKYPAFDHPAICSVS